jgi:hypothetical protein
MPTNDERSKMIHEIQEVLREWGNTSAEELGLDVCPVLACPLPNNMILVERFNLGDVDVTHYVHDREVDSDCVPYDELPDDVLFEVHQIIEEYGIECERAFNRSKD